MAWELGGNLGHVLPLLAIARDLHRRGHSVTFAIRAGSPGRSTIEEAGFPCLEGARIDAPRPSLVPEPASYSEILLNLGYGNPAWLLDACRIWRGIYERTAPDAVVFDYAPGAMLAARALRFPRIHFGTGFTIPPRQSPFPSYRTWLEVPTERLAASDARLLECFNSVLASFDAPALSATHQLFECEEELLATLPELDHYGPRAEGAYCGRIPQSTGGVEPAWPLEGGQRVFVYIRPESKSFVPLAHVLRKQGSSVVWFAPGLSEMQKRVCGAPTMAFSAQPLDMDRVAHTADAAIVHGGHGTVATMHMAGVPMLLLPESIEQLVLSSRVARMGAGVVLPAAMEGNLASAVHRLLNDGKRQNERRRDNRTNGHSLAERCELASRLEQGQRGLP